MSMSRKIKRFSLIEIMVVLIIIGLIAGLAIPAVMSRLEDSKQKTAKTQLKLLQSCLKTYYLDNDNYPASINDLVKDPGVNEKWKGPYLDDGVLPKDPWGNDYIYSIPGSNEHPYDLMSYGKDKSPGGEDADADVSCWEEKTE